MTSLPFPTSARPIPKPRYKSDYDAVHSETVALVVRESGHLHGVTALLTSRTRASETLKDERWLDKLRHPAKMPTEVVQVRV